MVEITKERSKNNNKKKTKTLTIMAEVMETQKHYASNAKGNAALTTGK